MCLDSETFVCRGSQAATAFERQAATSQLDLSFSRDALNLDETLILQLLDPIDFSNELPSITL